MRNPLSYRMESSLGAVFISLLALFFIGTLFAVIKNFETDMDIMAVSYNTPRVRNISGSELALMQEWIKVNHIQIPEGWGYKYLLSKYPNRPWLDQ